MAVWHIVNICKHGSVGRLKTKSWGRCMYKPRDTRVTIDGVTRGGHRNLPG